MIRDNGICHIEIPAADLEQTATFYETVFGWKVQRNVPHEEYWFFDSGNLAGGFERQDEVHNKGIAMYIRTDDVDATLSSIAKAGGVIEEQKTALPNDFGFVGRFTDPTGNRLGLWSPAKEDA